ncbi:MAG: hypothetical protein ACR2HB_04075 [Dehalococcoidia bacterium]
MRRRSPLVEGHVGMLATRPPATLLAVADRDPVRPNFDRRPLGQVGDQDLVHPLLNQLAATVCAGG